MCGMENVHCLVLTVLYLCMRIRTFSNAQGGEFLSLSIDCGATSSYNDTLGINWVTDDEYIKTGEKGQMQPDGDLPQQLFSFRYFTSARSKNCYVLPVKALTTYLLRVRLFPGFDSADGTPPIILPVDFSVFVNSNHWFSYSAVDDSSRDAVVHESVFYSFEKTEVYLCLLKGTEHAPFINSVELRMLPNESYTLTNDGETFMVLGDRINTGTAPEDNSIVRYPDDDFDRFWWPAVPTRFPAALNFTRVERPSENLEFYNYTPSGAGGYNWPPRRIFIDAWVGRNLSFGITKERSGPEIIYSILYFKEIRLGSSDTELGENPVGIMLGINGSSAQYNLTDLIERQFTLDTEQIDSDFMSITVESEPWSIKDAILNGFEYYYVYDIELDATYSEDKTTLHEIQESFNLQDWTGDPCYPVAWDWLTCDPNTSRVQTLKLTNMSISGWIPENISRLAELTEIHLDNNNLQGSIPQSIASLMKLKILALDNNNLTGDIPSAILNRSGLNFTFTGNPGLCASGDSSCDSISPAQSPQQVQLTPNESSPKSAVPCARISFLLLMFILVSIW